MIESVLDGVGCCTKRAADDPDDSLYDQETNDATAEMLEAAGQAHLLEDLDDAGRARLLAQARRLDLSYSGGLGAYVTNARRLLQASQNGDNPFDGYTPSVPLGERVVYGDDRFNHLEALGLQEAKATAFVLVAGGLGERLGFSGIKLALPATVITGWSYLEMFCRSILAAQELGEQNNVKPIPLVIMTSDDTHVRTVDMLEANAYFGLSKDQVHVLKQEKVACLVDSEARIGKDPNDASQIETKPHGHGDVHVLLHTSGLARRFKEQGIRWLAFFQDTNGFFFRAITATLGVSKELNLAMNSQAVPRKPKDAMGGIACLTHTNGSSITLNVEYNQLDPLLRSTINPDGDAADATGYSPFPGNMNSLVLAMDQYLSTLDRTGGIIAEFVNPKYADASKTDFKSSTRLECMMQDFPKALLSEDKVGFTMFDTWCAYSPVKNNPEEARKKFQTGNHPQSGVTGETDLFGANCRILRMAGVDIEAAKKATFNGITVDLEARVVWSPRWAASYSAVRSRFSPSSRVQISQRSTLILDGDVVLEDLKLDGALAITARPGCTVRVRCLTVTNDGWTLEAVPSGGGQADEVANIRGFSVRRLAAREFLFEDSGEHVIDEPAGLL